MFWICFFFFKQKTAYEMRISDWSSDVCSSDLTEKATAARGKRAPEKARSRNRQLYKATVHHRRKGEARRVRPTIMIVLHWGDATGIGITLFDQNGMRPRRASINGETRRTVRSEEHTSELQSLMSISYAVLCLKKKTYRYPNRNTTY